MHIISNSPKNTAYYGDKITITAKPDEGYEISDININGKQSSKIEFIMPAEDVAIKVTYKKIVYTLSLEYDSSVVTVTGIKAATNANAGDTYMFKVTPKTGYEISEVKANGTTVKAVNGSYKVTQPRENLVILITVKAIQENKTGWAQEGGNWFYYNSKGTKVTGWQLIGGTWYFFDSKAVMQTGWVDDGGKWYYMNASGAMTTGWIQSGGKWYYLGSSGAMATGWIQDGKNWYYMSSSGAMATGWIQLGGKWYFMSASGAMATGWVKSGNTWYYMSPSGAMVANGWLQAGNTWYYFNSNGAMVTGEFEIDGKKSKFSSSGAWIGYV